MIKYEYIFGFHAVRHLLLVNPAIVRCLYLQSGSERSQRLTELVELAGKASIPVHYDRREVLGKYVPPGVPHQGAVAQVLPHHSTQAVGEDFGFFLEHLLSPAFLLILDGVQDPRNLGACLRTACALGVDAVIVPKDRAVGLTPIVRKVACGAAETLPFFQVTNVARVLRALKQRNVWVFGAVEQAPQSVYSADLRGSVAWVLGSERQGLRQLTRKQCDVLLRIPTETSFSTLNVSVAAGICLAETWRQRSL